MGRSVAQEIAELPPAERNALLADIDPLSLNTSWDFWARPEQLVPSVPWNVFAYVAGRGSGKDLELSTTVPTPTGWTTMGEIRAGDVIFDEAGQPTHVLIAHDVSIPERAYRLTFSDGTTIDAGGEHQWVTYAHRDRKQYQCYENPGDFPEDWPTHRIPLYDSWGNITGEIGPQIRLTDDLFATQTINTRGDRNHCIPLAGPLSTRADTTLPLDPWLLGYWLGNGASNGGALAAGSKDGDFDADHVAGCVASAGFEYSRRDLPDKGHSLIYVRGLMAVLRSMDLMHNKHIPASYLRASVDQRLALLRGLMDSDGYADPIKNTVEFCSMLQPLAMQVLELVRSISERPVLARGRAMFDGKDYGEKYRVTWRPSRFSPFALQRKAVNISDPDAQGLRLRHRMITKIEPIDPVPMRCLTVDSPNSMYLVSDAMIPTHNTRSGCEWARDKAKTMPGSRGLLVARTAADVRDVIISGESGILNICPPSERPLWEPSKRRLSWPNGSTAIAFSAEEPDQLRGPQGDWGLADEFASWKNIPDDSGLTAWDNLQIACRLGDQPQIFVMTTPKRTEGLSNLIARATNDPKVILRRGSTRDNAANLSPAYLEMIYGLYKGTRLAQQELEGMMLDDVEGALWSYEMLQACRVNVVPLGRLQIVVGVDPSVAENPKDECGIVVVGVTKERRLYQRHAYILEDASIHGSPDTWAERVAVTARKWNAPIIAEINQGGDLIRKAIATLGPDLRIFGVHSRQNKQLRAEPVVMAYEQGRVHHVGAFADLESQQLSWVPGETRKSPDRVDAMVHAATALLIEPPKGMHFGGVRASSAAQKRLPASRSAKTLLNPRSGRGRRAA